MDAIKRTVSALVFVFAMVVVLDIQEQPRGVSGPSGWLWWTVLYRDNQGVERLVDVKLKNKDTTTNAKAKAAAKKAVEKLK